MRRVEENRHASSLQLPKEVESQTGVTISRDTIRRTLQRNGMHGCCPRKKPLLKPRHKKACLEFARAHADKDDDYWDSIIWSDETKINVFGTDGISIRGRPIIDIGHFQNRVADNVFFIFYYANKHTIYR